jgi:hypothetical protein
MLFHKCIKIFVESNFYVNFEGNSKVKSEWISEGHWHNSLYISKEAGHLEYSLHEFVQII